MFKMYPSWSECQIKYRVLSYPSISNKQQTIVLVDLMQCLKHNYTKTVICCLFEIQIELRALYI